jgi:hypothetical protein
MAVSYGLIDAKSVAIIYAVKFYRIMVLWVLLYVMDKVYQSKYVEDVYVAHDKSPSLLYMPLYVVAIESLSFLLVFCLLLMLERRFKNGSNSYLVDQHFLLHVMADYVLTTLAMIPAGVAVAYVLSSPYLRYNHDGLRGIRACTELMLAVFSVIVLLPCFLAY